MIVALGWEAEPSSPSRDCMTSSSNQRHRQRDEEDVDYDERNASSISHRHGDYSHRHENGKGRDRSRPRSPSHRKKREHQIETREERKERKRREEKEHDVRRDRPRKANRDGERDDHRKSRKRSRSGETLNIVDEGADEGHSRREILADTDPLRFDKSVSQLSNPEMLALQSHAAPSHSSEAASLPSEPITVSTTQRDDWMLSGVDKEAEANTSTDYFTNMGSYSRVKKPKPDKPNPDHLKISSREINAQFAQGKHLDEYEKFSTSASQPGGPGYQWRMMKLRRVYEAAEDEGRDVEEVALERYGSMEAFNEARIERQHLDDQQGRRGDSHALPQGRSHYDSSASASSSRPISRQSFRKPGESSIPSTPQAGSSTSAKRVASSPKPSTPIPSVFTPVLSRAGSKLRHLTGEQENDSEDASSSVVQDAVNTSQTGGNQSHPPLSAAALNRLSAKLLRAEMIGSEDAQELRKQLDRENARAQSGGDQGFNNGNKEAFHHVGSGVEEDVESSIQVLPTLDARGRLYDVGTNTSSKEDEELRPGNRRKKNSKFESGDAKTGELLRYNADDDEQSLQDLVRQERFAAGSADQKNADAEMASRIVGDQAFKDNVDYMDDNVEKLARKKMKTDAMKRQFAIQDFAKTKKALDACAFCWQEEGAKPPRSTVVCSGTRVYLALPLTEPLTEGHCLIVPMQHHLSSLEADDDTWEEVKNFMKCLMQMASTKKQGVIFYETVKSIKQQRHAFIEAVCIDHDLYQDLPGYFKQSIMTTGDEWSQHKKLIEFSSTRSFRRCMVPQLPYFMIQWDYKGEKGYGHVIEDGEGCNGGDDFEMTKSSKGGGDFPLYFAAEIIGSLLDYEPRRWRKPRRLHDDEKQSRLKAFKTMWKPYDWTTMIGQ